MMCKKIEYNETNLFSKISLDYRSENPHFSSLISNFPNLNNFENQITEKSKNYNNIFRKDLTDVLNEQYKNIELNEAQRNNIDSLKRENSFTITTGHQLNLLTGPLYFIYKIISVINLSESLKKKYDKYDFIPVFWMASEDHDFNEINNFTLSGKTFKWESNQTGMVGDFNLKNINDVLDEFENFIVNTTHGKELGIMVKEAYLNSKNLAEATRVLVNKIFKEFGLIIIDANNSKLKGLFKQSIIKELTEGLVKNCSEKSIKKLKTLNYKIQAPPRDINLFYVQKNKRERLIKTGDSYTTENRLKSWTSEQIIKEINENPENFSPNVLMRPLYQEFVLPNLCYIGGPAEIAYWLQIKPVFDNEKITFPLLLSRCSALIISKKTIKKFKKYDLGIEEIFLSEHLLKNKLITKFSKHKLDFSDLKNLLKIQFSKLKDISKNTDKSFIGALSAQEKKQINGLTKLEKRLINSEKRIYSEKISRVMNLLSEVFPDGKFQERHLNFSDFYKDLGQDFIINIKDNLDPLNQKFTIIEI